MTVPATPEEEALVRLGLSNPWALYWLWMTEGRVRWSGDTWLFVAGVLEAVLSGECEPPRNAP